MRLLRLALAVTLLAAWIGAEIAGAQTDSLDAAENRRKLEEVQRGIQEQREAAQRVKRQESGVMTQIKRSDRAIKTTRRQLNILTSRRKKLGTQLEITKLDLQRNTASLRDQRDRLRRRLRATYKFGPVGEMELLLSTASFAQLLARWDFLVMVAEQDRALMENIRDRKEVVETIERRLEGNLTQIERTARRTSSQNQRLAQQRDERAEALRKLQTQRQAYEAAAMELERTAKAIKSVLAQLERKRTGVAPYTGDFAKGQGSLDWPARGNLIGRFGPERHPRHNVVIPNNGIDIELPIGTSVRVVGKGKVDYVAEDYGTYGQMVIVNHGDSYYTLYGHLSEIAVSVGDEIQSGQAIGRSGDTGSLKGPILHFEVRRGTAALNPEDWLQ